MKHLGQHFLINKEKNKKIAAALELKTGETVIEIGPGHGELTRELLAFSFKLLENGDGLKIIAIEKDKILAEQLEKKFAGYKNVEIITEDVLKILPEINHNLKLKAKNLKLVGNIPYYITGYLLRTIGELESKPNLCVFTIQKEVAERICAKPPKMNLLAASVQFWSEPEIIDFIPRKDFSPQPKVDSAVIRLITRKDANIKRNNAKDYYKFIKILFKQPRKTVLNNIADGYKNETREEIIKKLKNCGIEPNLRPQNLEIRQILGISKIFN